MNLEHYIRERLTTKPLCLMTHVIAGYPSFDDNLRALEIMAQHDVDVVEIQMPFSEPIADGPVFTRANQEALKRGATVARYFEFMQRAAATFDFPLLMMGYYNPIFKMGEARFLERLEQSGGKGFILPDLPFELGANLYAAAKQRGIAPIAMITPSNTPERLQQLGRTGEGFVYVVARKGVTGKQTQFEHSIRDYLAQCRAATSLPLAVGFGISKKTDMEFLTGQAEIAIIGTAILEAWERSGAAGLHEFFHQLTC